MSIFRLIFFWLWTDLLTLVCQDAFQACFVNHWVALHMTFSKLFTQYLKDIGVEQDPASE